jgi:predicted regulator of Ras-like GTPase activity (Roadblock/LC7/MglB family)
MYLKLMERSQNAAQIDSGLTLMAAGFAQPQNQQSLIQLAAAEGRGAGGGFGIKEMLDLRKAAAEEQGAALRRQQLPALAKQYNLDDATIQYLDQTDQLDEVIAKMADPDTEVVKSADGSNILINKRTGANIKNLSPAAPRETEFQELGDGSKVLVYQDDNTEVATGKPLTNIKAPIKREIIQDYTGANILVEDGKQVGTITEGDPGKGDYTVERADGSSARYNNRNELITELSPPKIDRQFHTGPNGEVVVSEDGQVVGTIIEGDPNKGDYTVERADGSSARYSRANELIKELSPAKVERNFITGYDGEVMVVENGKKVGVISAGDPNKGDYTVERADGSSARYNKQNELIKELSPAKVLNAEDKDKLADINKERAAQGKPKMTVEEFQTAFNKSGTSVYVDTQGNKLPNPPEDMVWKMDADGKAIIGADGAPIAVWVKGSPGEVKYQKDKLEAEKAASAAKATEENKASLHERDVVSKSAVYQAIDDSLGILNRNKEEWLPAAGTGAGMLRGLGIGGQSVDTLSGQLETITANQAFDELASMRAAAAAAGATSGASGLGQVTEKEHKMLSSVWGSLAIGQEPEQLRYTLKRIRRAMKVLAFNDFPDNAEGMAAFQEAMKGFEKDAEPEAPASDVFKEEDEEAQVTPPEGAKKRRYNRETGKFE